MYIHEAVKEALAKKARVMRQSAVEPGSDIYAVIKPTNSYDACILIIVEDDVPSERGCRCWNPTADDLMADDWVVVRAS